MPESDYYNNVIYLCPFVLNIKIINYNRGTIHAEKAFLCHGMLELRLWDT